MPDARAPPTMHCLIAAQIQLLSHRQPAQRLVTPPFLGTPQLGPERSNWQVRHACVERSHQPLPTRTWQGHSQCALWAGTKAHGLPYARISSIASSIHWKTYQGFTLASLASALPCSIPSDLRLPNSLQQLHLGRNSLTGTVMPQGLVWPSDMQEVRL